MIFGAFSSPGHHCRKWPFLHKAEPKIFKNRFLAKTFDWSVLRTSGQRFWAAFFMLFSGIPHMPICYCFLVLRHGTVNKEHFCNILDLFRNYYKVNCKHKVLTENTESKSTFNENILKKWNWIKYHNSMFWDSWNKLRIFLHFQCHLNWRALSTYIS